jgi:hypothetical protein
LSRNRYICIVGGIPSGGVDMFALLRWSTSGPPGRPAPSSVWVSTASAPSKLPEAASKPMAGFSRWSWKRETR